MPYVTCSLCGNSGIQKSDIDRFVEEGSLKLIYNSKGISVADKEVKDSEERKKGMER